MFFASSLCKPEHVLMIFFNLDTFSKICFLIELIKRKKIVHYALNLVLSTQNLVSLLNK